MAINLQFETGNWKEYQFNQGEPIRINVSDIGIVNRLEKVINELDSIKAKYEGRNDSTTWDEVDKIMRQRIDDILACPGACDKAMGLTHCFSPCSNGKLLIENFFGVFIPQLKKDITSSVNASKMHLESLDNEKTQKYITQSTPQSLPASAISDGASGTISLALLSANERERLMNELQRAGQ